jgi:hypothetical protein
MSVEINLSFQTEDSHHPDHWLANASTNGSVDYDATGATPLDAVMKLAKVLYEAAKEAE